MRDVHSCVRLGPLLGIRDPIWTYAVAIGLMCDEISLLTLGLLQMTVLYKRTLKIGQNLIQLWQKFGGSLFSIILYNITARNGMFKYANCNSRYNCLVCVDVLITIPNNVILKSLTCCRGCWPSLRQCCDPWRWAAIDRSRDPLLQVLLATRDLTAEEVWKFRLWSLQIDPLWRTTPFRLTTNRLSLSHLPQIFISPSTCRYGLRTAKIFSTVDLISITWN